MFLLYSSKLVLDSPIKLIDFDYKTVPQAFLDFAENFIFYHPNSKKVPDSEVNFDLMVIHFQFKAFLPVSFPCHLEVEAFPQSCKQNRLILCYVI